MKKDFELNGKKYIFDGNELELYLVNGKASIKNNDKIKMHNSENKTLFKLVFNVSNTCNLNCKYCYANGGNYNRKDNLMTIKTSNNIINSVIKKYDIIKTVYFFGGEPLLNFKVIQNVVTQLKKYYKNQKIDFRVVTNGLFLTKDKIDFFDKNNFKLYISIDGPKKIHEYLRGNGTYDIIINNLRNIKNTELCNRTILLCTYTKYHQDNISFNKLTNFFENLGYKYTINGVETNNEKLKILENTLEFERKKEYIDISIDRILTNSNNIGISYELSSVIDALLFHNKHEHFCKELANNYSNVYDYNGDIYGCIRLLGKYKINDERIAKNNKKNSLMCKNCWCKNLCTLCLANILLKTSKFPYNDNDCNLKKLYEYSLKKIIEMLNNNPDNLTKLLNNYCTNFLK